jgi:sulfofructose kinase
MFARQGIVVSGFGCKINLQQVNMDRSSSGYDVVGLGVSTLDLVMVVAELPGQELVQRAYDSVLEGGGPVATAMVTLARLGARTAMIDKLGDDWRGKLIVDEFRREEVSADHVVTAPQRSSSIASILVRKADGARTITYAPGDAGELLPDELPADVLSSAAILHLNGRHLEASLVLAKHAKEHGVLVSFDGGAHRYRRELDEILGLSDVCIVARQFASSFSGLDDVAASAAKLIRFAPRVVVITAGAEGSWIFEKDGESFHQPAFQVDQVVDTTGAGDAFHGGFLFGLVRGYCLRSCALLASAVAAMNTRRLGGRAGLPSLQETFRFLAERGVSLEKADL